MADKEYWRQQVRAAAPLWGVPPDLADILVNSESGFNPLARAAGSSAYGLFQLTKGTAADMGVDPSDPYQNIQGGLKYLREGFDKLGSWDKAVERFKGVYGAANAAAHPNEARSAQDVQSRFSGLGVLYPGLMGSGAAPDATAVRQNPWGSVAQNWAGLQQAQQGVEQLANQPLNYPRRTPPPERTIAGTVLPGFLSDLATAISGNPLYQAGFNQQLEHEQGLRERVQEQNWDLSTQEIQQMRSQRLQARVGQLEIAKARLEQAGRWEDAAAQGDRQAAILREIQQLKGSQEIDLEKQRFEDQMQLAGFKKGAQGWEVDMNIQKLGKMPTADQVMQRRNEIYTLLHTKKRDKSADPMLLDELDQLDFATPVWGQNMGSIRAMAEAKFANELNQYQNDPAKLAAVHRKIAQHMFTVALANPWVEGAKDYIDAANTAANQQMLNAPGETPSAGEAAGTAAAPAQAEAAAPTSRMLEPEGPRANVDVGPWVAEKNYKSAQEKVKNLEKFIKQFSGTADSTMIAHMTDSLSVALKELERANTNMETIRNRGKKPVTAKK